MEQLCVSGTFAPGGMSAILHPTVPRKDLEFPRRIEAFKAEGSPINCKAPAVVPNEVAACTLNHVEAQVRQPDTSLHVSPS